MQLMTGCRGIQVPPDACQGQSIFNAVRRLESRRERVPTEWFFPRITAAGSSEFLNLKASLRDDTDR